MAFQGFAGAAALGSAGSEKLAGAQRGWSSVWRVKVPSAQNLVGFMLAKRNQNMRLVCLQRLSPQLRL